MDPCCFYVNIWYSVEKWINICFSFFEVNNSDFGLFSCSLLNWNTPYRNYCIQTNLVFIDNKCLKQLRYYSLSRTLIGIEVDFWIFKHLGFRQTNIEFSLTVLIRSERLIRSYKISSNFSVFRSVRYARSSLISWKVSCSPSNYKDQTVAWMDIEKILFVWLDAVGSSTLYIKGWQPIVSEKLELWSLFSVLSTFHWKNFH